MNSFSENFDFTSFWILELETMFENPTRIIGLVIVLGAVVAAIIYGGGQEKFLDMPSLLLVAIIGVGNVIGAKGDDSILTKFGDGCVRGAWIGFLIGLILIADAQIFASMNVPALGAAMSVCMLPLFYGYTLKFLSTQIDWESIEQKQQIDPLTFFSNW